VEEPLRIPGPVRAKAIRAGAGGWLAGLPGLIRDLEREWQITAGPPFEDATEAWVAPATGPDGGRSVLKLMLPRPGDHARHEITALRIGRGEGLAALRRADAGRGAMLLERLGPSMAEVGMPLGDRLAVLTGLARRVWRPAPGSGLPTGADKGRWLIDVVRRTWTELDRPCDEAAVEHAVTCAGRRIAAHDDERAVLVHGDIHQWNALRAGAGFKLVDPDGLLAEPEYDLGVLMREDPVELMAGDPWDRARRLAAATGTDAAAIFQWGAVERVATGLLLTSIGLREVGGQMLSAAERISRCAG
jgi:streptomycin 6-kinase